MNWNTALISLVVAITLGTFNEMKSTHDAVIQIQVKLSSYDTQMTDIRTRLSAIEAHQATIDTEIMKLKGGYK